MGAAVSGRATVSVTVDSEASEEVSGEFGSGIWSSDFFDFLERRGMPAINSSTVFVVTLVVVLVVVFRVGVSLEASSRLVGCLSWANIKAMTPYLNSSPPPAPYGR